MSLLHLCNQLCRLPLEVLEMTVPSLGKLFELRLLDSIDSLEFSLLPILELMLTASYLSLTNVVDAQFCLLSFFELFICLTLSLILDKHFHEGMNVR